MTDPGNELIEDELVAVLLDEAAFAERGVVGNSDASDWWRERAVNLRKCADRIASDAKRIRELEEERARLREALVMIKDGRGKCGICGALAIGDRGGVVGYGCCNDPRAFWEPNDPKDIARKALESDND